MPDDIEIVDPYGTTPNYGLRFPNGTAPVDVAGDISNLASDVDNAISLNWDTATDDQKTAVAASTAPVRLYGAGRPDGYHDGGSGKADSIIAPLGSVFYCTGPLDYSPGGNWGARTWQMVTLTDDNIDIRWTVTVGQTPRFRHSDDTNAKTLIKRYPDHMWFKDGGGYREHYMASIPAATNGWSLARGGEVCRPVYHINSDSDPSWGKGYKIYRYDGLFSYQHYGADNAYNLRSQEQVYNNDTHTYNPWPYDVPWDGKSNGPMTIQDDVEALERMIREAEEDEENPYHTQLDTLKAELESLRSNDE